jgi:hypothetical protein
MADRIRRRLTAAGLLAALALLLGAATAQVAGHAQVVDGIVVYFGLIPGEIILGPGGRNAEQHSYGNFSTCPA